MPTKDRPSTTGFVSVRVLTSSGLKNKEAITSCLEAGGAVRFVWEDRKPVTTIEIQKRLFSESRQSESPIGFGYIMVSTYEQRPDGSNGRILTEYFALDHAEQALLSFLSRSIWDPLGKSSHSKTLSQIVEQHTVQKMATVPGPVDPGFVKATVEPMEPIPPNSNPFHHDLYNMGSDLVRGWMAMHRGFDSAERPLDLDYVILVNTRTGQRIKVKLDRLVPKQQDDTQDVETQNNAEDVES